jgi:hypothetical protein
MDTGLRRYDEVVVAAVPSVRSLGLRLWGYPSEEVADLGQIERIGVSVEPDLDRSGRERSEQPLVVERNRARTNVRE